MDIHKSTLRISHTHRLVFDSGTGDTQVKFTILLNAGINQRLDRALILEQQECISWKKLYSQNGECALNAVKKEVWDT